jgi:thiol:disulfide interchange protein DsbD
MAYMLWQVIGIHLFIGNSRQEKSKMYNVIQRFNITRLIVLLPLYILLSLSNISLASSEINDNEKPKFLNPEDAFMFSYTEKEDTLSLNWEIAEGYYLYQKRLKIKADGETIELPTLPKGELKQDKYFGEVFVYHDSLSFNLNTKQAKTISLSYQGCAEAGLCYPPQKVNINLTGSEPEQVQSKSQTLFDNFTDKSAVYTLLIFFAMGVATAFAGCSYPMFPILSKIIVGHKGEVTKLKGFTLSLAYVLPIAFVYAGIGVVAGLFGSNLSAWFQQPIALFVVSATLFLMALSMFGVYEIQMPSSIQTRLSSISGNQSGGSYLSAALMGFISAFIVSACVVPPIVAAVTYITQTGDMLLGAGAMFCFGLGLGFPLLLLGMSASWLLPKAGNWMDSIQKVMAIFLLSGAIWIIDRIIPSWLTYLLWASLAAFVSIYLFQKVPGKFAKVISAISGVLALGILVNGFNEQFNSDHHSNFEYLENNVELKAALQKNTQQIVLIDFYADWCTACQYMEKHVFTDPKISAQVTQFKTIKIDLSDMSKEKEALMKQYGVIGPPAYLFISPSGKELESLRVVGEVDSDEFSTILSKALSSLPSKQ